MNDQERLLHFIEFLGVMSGLLAVNFTLELPHIPEPIGPYLVLLSTGFFVVFVYYELLSYVTVMRGTPSPALLNNVVSFFGLLLANTIAISVLFFIGYSSFLEGALIYLGVLIPFWFLMSVASHNLLG